MARTTTFTEQHRVGKVKEFLVSGLTASEFCRRHGIADSTFSVWTKRLAPSKKTGPRTKFEKKQKQKPNSQPQIKIAFAPVKLLEPRTVISGGGRQQLNAHSALAMEIVLPSGALIRLANNCSPSFVAAALAAIAVQ
jgi:transposase-like protein